MIFQIISQQTYQPTLNNLTFSSPLVNTTNTISFNESAITTLTNFYNQTQSDGRYLRLTGGTISGTLIINTELQVTTTTSFNQIKLKTTTSGTYASMSFENNNAKFGYIGVAGTSITGYYANNLFLEANNSLIFNSGGQQTGSIPRMIINNDGNIGIGTSNPGTNNYM